jgi:hypothetical protein
VGALIVIAGVVVVLVLTLGGGKSKSTKATTTTEETSSTSTETSLWTSAQENAFLESCTGGGAPTSTCRCALGKVEDRYPDPADLAALPTDEQTTIGRQAGRDCA